ncbi:MAG: hypothetical protein GY866_42780 [Proteobacteria bacterium]|nr:hypothetical protein [Pseudomonadota bacterium]
MSIAIAGNDILDNLYRLKDKFDSNGIFLSFNGPISQNLMVEMGDLLKRKMTLQEAGRTTMVRVFSALVEQSQNIIRHSAEKIPEQNGRGENMKFGAIAVGYRSGSYFVIGGNKIQNDDVDRLNRKLSKLRKMNGDELKIHYKRQRKARPDRGYDDTGLGLIELARKTSRPIEFNFEKIDERFSFFSLKAVI